ncbi:MAG: phage tail protein [Burkholderiales bacterium]
MSDPYIGQIQAFGFNFAPRGWAQCNGQLLSIAQNQALFALLGTMYGGNGQTTFGLPDLRGRSPIHLGQGPGLSNYVQGEVGGVEVVTLSPQQMPAHTHAARALAGNGNSKVAQNNVWAKDAGVSSATYSSAVPDANMSAQAIANAGGSQPHENRPPYLAVNWCIALEGIFPSRN